MNSEKGRESQVSSVLDEHDRGLNHVEKNLKMSVQWTVVLELDIMFLGIRLCQRSQII